MISKRSLLSVPNRRWASSNWVAESRKDSACGCIRAASNAGCAKKNRGDTVRPAFNADWQHGRPLRGPASASAESDRRRPWRPGCGVVSPSRDEGLDGCLVRLCHCWSNKSAASVRFAYGQNTRTQCSERTCFTATTTEQVPAMWLGLLRIPGEMGHWFRLKWGSHSDRSGALIPAGSGALFG